jgi:hypothetical protein
MIWPILAVALAQATDTTLYAYNPNTEAAWCAAKPVPKEEGLPISADGGRTFPNKPAWCSPGVVMETAGEHKAHKKTGPCEIEWAMWQVALRKTEERFREGK